MSPPAGSLWRAFPRDPHAAEGQRFSAAFVPPSRGVGRFDLPNIPAGVLYLAESPAHGIAERIQELRNQTLSMEDLSEGGHRYALAHVIVAPDAAGRIADLCNPATLHDLDIAPDDLAARDRRVTQAIARQLHESGYAGLRWWSVFFGEWHTVVLFRDRTHEAVRFADVHTIALTDPPLIEAARALAIEIHTD